MRHKRHNQTTLDKASRRASPDSPPPTLAEFAQWLGKDCRKDILAEANVLARPVIHALIDGAWIAANPLHTAPASVLESLYAAPDAIDTAPVLGITGMTADGALLLDGKVDVADGAMILRIPLTLAELADAYNGLPRKGRPAWLLRPLLREWHSPARSVERNAHKGRRIAPGPIAMRIEGKHAPKLYAPAAHANPDPKGQLVLPGFLRADEAQVALPAELWAIGAGKDVSRGRGLPWAQRLFWLACLEAALADRGTGTIRMTIPLGELIKAMYPNGDPPGRQRWWPTFLAAVKDLESQESRIPYFRQDTKTWALRRMVTIIEHPADPLDAHGPVVFSIDLPPGSDKGPQVSDNLLAWAAKDAAAARMLINLAYRWYNPGVSQRPIGKRADGKGKIWPNSDDPAHYDLAADDVAELVRYSAPLGSDKTARIQIQNAKKALNTLHKAGELRIVEGKVLPPKHTGK